MSVIQVSVDSDYGLLPIRRQAIFKIDAGLLSIVPTEKNYSEIWIEMQNVSFMKMQLKISSAKWWPFCPGEIS